MSMSEVARLRNSALKNELKYANDRIRELEAEVEDLDEKLETAQAYNGEARIQELEARLLSYEGRNPYRRIEELEADREALKEAALRYRAALREIANAESLGIVNGIETFGWQADIARRALEGGQG